MTSVATNILSLTKSLTFESEIWTQTEPVSSRHAAKIHANMKETHIMIITNYN